jgi:type IV secretory pathway VirB4 component
MCKYPGSYSLNVEARCFFSRVNGTIKNATVKAITYQNIDEMKQDLNKFLIFYNFNRGHGGLRKEIKVRTPYEAESKEWKDYRLETFEEIIKEGRKFNVFMTIASQRPSDISATIIGRLMRL